MRVSEFEQVNKNALEIGLKRLGVVLDRSKSIQSISTRDFQQITKSLFTVPVSKDQIVQLRKGNVTPSIETLRRLTPLLFKVDHFIVTDSDPVGTPVFKYDEGNYKDSKDLKVKMKTIHHVEDLPHLEYRYSDYYDLVRIVLGEVDFKKVLDLSISVA